MALLVASLLMVALAPVMTKKFNETINLSGGGFQNGEYAKIFTEDTEWRVPGDVEKLNIYLIGGGGAGGGATYGSQIFTETTSGWVVPQNVTKLKVFMTGAGGGGAAGGVGDGVHKQGTTGTTDSQIYDETFGTGVGAWTIPNSAKGNVPEINYKCAKNSVTKWTVIPVTNASDWPFPQTRTASPGDTVVAVKACGGGGGGDRGTINSSGAGGYVYQRVAIPSSFSSVGFTIGGGGGSGSPQNGEQAPTDPTGWGGGGGGAEVGWVLPQTYRGPSVPPGGIGGYMYVDCKVKYFDNAENGEGTYSKTIGSTTYTAGARAGSYWCQTPEETGLKWGQGNTYSGYGSLEGGGGGGSGSTGGGGAGGGGATFFGRYTHSGIDDENIKTDQSFFLVAAGGGGAGYHDWGSGGGGGGAGGGSGGNATSSDGGAVAGAGHGSSGQYSPIGNDSYCAGGTQMTSGKPGYMEITWGPDQESIQCSYSENANGGGGGGAGQVWVGEIAVTPGQVINFTVGEGGAKQLKGGTDGNKGGDTSIAIAGGATYTVTGGAGGKFEKTESNMTNSGGGGGGLKTASLSNWTSISNSTFSTKAGLKGEQGYFKTQSGKQGYGGGGGGTVSMTGGTLSGGTRGTGNSNGSDAPENNYGAGGGGGGGAVSGSNSDFGTGGKGANGYIYVEWGGTNGGGGASGQFIEKKNIWVKSDSKLKIKIGKGGQAADILTESLGTTGFFGQRGADGTSTTIEIPDDATYEAKGGFGGEQGTSVHGKGGNYDDSMEASTKGLDGDDNYGGNGGNITKEICPLLYALLKTSIAGCGGLYSDGGITCNSPNTGGVGNIGLGFGAGGGGGAVKDEQGLKGGNGTDGVVILQWRSTYAVKY